METVLENNANIIHDNKITPMKKKVLKLRFNKFINQTLTNVENRRPKFPQLSAIWSNILFLKIKTRHDWSRSNGTFENSPNSLSSEHLFSDNKDRHIGACEIEPLKTVLYQQKHWIALLMSISYMWWLEVHSNQALNLQEINWSNWPYFSIISNSKLTQKYFLHIYFIFKS